MTRIYSFISLMILLTPSVASLHREGPPSDLSDSDSSLSFRSALDSEESWDSDNLSNVNFDSEAFWSRHDSATESSRDAIGDESEISECEESSSSTQVSHAEWYAEDIANPKVTQTKQYQQKMARKSRAWRLKNIIKLSKKARQ